MGEADPLLNGAQKGETALQSPVVAADDVEQVTQRDWDGHLLSMCGSCDHNGISSFAYVKLLSPLACVSNAQRAFGGGFWRRRKYEHTVVFSLLLASWGFYIFSPPCPALDPKEDLPVGPGGKQILPGATLDPDIAKLFPDNAEWADPEDLKVPQIMEENRVEHEEGAPLDKASEDEDQQIQAQVQTAKSQAAESMAQLGAGRKLLHKHKHDHDNEKHDHKHHDDDHDETDDDDDDDHKEKGWHKHDKEEKDGGKDHKKHKKEGKKFKAPKDGPKGPPRPGCEDVNNGILGMLVVLTSFTIIFYATEMRTAIRTRYGIKGSMFRDCLAWTFCSACALCQETRTLAKNNVHDGTWYGEIEYAQPSAEPMQAPNPLEAPTKPV